MTTTPYGFWDMHMPNHKGYVFVCLPDRMRRLFGCRLFYDCKNHMQNCSNIAFEILPLTLGAHLMCLYIGRSFLTFIIYSIQIYFHFSSLSSTSRRVCISYMAFYFFKCFEAAAAIAAWES